MSRVPRIRFKGFEEDWEQRKLGDIVREVTRVDENSNAPVMMITANDGFIEQSERYSTDNAGRSLKKYILLKKWELAYNHGASKIRPFGSCFALTRAANIRIPFVYHCFLALEDNPEFLEYTLNSKNVENQLRKIVSSGARMDGLLNISFQEYTSIFIRCPIRKEQDIIAILIKSLDHIITLHQRKLEKLKIIKKSMLENLFPQNGEKTPKIRFSGFTEDWEQRKLKYFADYKSSSLTVKDCKEEGKYDLYDANQVIGKTDKFVIDEDYITIIKDGAGVGRTRKLSKNTAFIGTMGALTVNNSDLDFLYATLNRIDWNTKTFGSTIPHIYFKDYGEKVYGEPSIEEQKKIGLYFKNIDTLITLHQSKSFGHILKVIVSCTLSWEQRKLGEMVERIIRKNEKLESTLPLTISAQYGLIDQNEFFDRRIASKDVRGYYLIKKGEFAYNKSTSVDAPLGAIKRLDKYKNGVLSTLYILFKIIDDTSTSSDYLVTYYATDLWHRGIQSIAAEGARNHGLLNIAPNDFFDTMLSIPLNISEQKKVGDFFISLDHLITLHQLEPFQLIFKAIAYRIIDYAKSKPLNSTK